MVVHNDESLFCHKPKVCTLTHVCTLTEVRHIVYFIPEQPWSSSTTQEVWVFGMVDTSTSPALPKLGYVEEVYRRDAATLLPIINAHTAPGSVIHSDMWAVYRRVQHLYTSCSCSQYCESLPQFCGPCHWCSYRNRVKTKLKRIKGCHAH